MELLTKEMSDQIGVGGAVKWQAKAVQGKDGGPVEASWPVAAKVKMTQHLEP